MTSMFSKPKAPDNSAQKAQIEKQNADIAAQEAEQRTKDAAKLRSRRGATGAGGNTLLTGLETGLRDTLG